MSCVEERGQDVMFDAYRSLIEESRDGLFLVTTDGRILEINSAGVELFGYSSREEMIGIHLVADQVDPDDRACLLEALALDGAVRNLDTRLRRKSGEWITVAISATALRDLSGKILGYRGSLRDVTQQRRDVVALREAEERALQAEKLRALGQMASGIAHDLNQALGLVVGHGELALRHLDPPRHWPGASLPGGPDGARDSLRILIKAAMDGAETVKRLLAFSRAQPDGERESVDVGQLLAEVAKLTAPHWRDAAQAEGRPIVLTVDAQGEPSVAGSPASLREALANLIFNAVDALPRGGNIVLHTRLSGDTVVVEVRDDGLGMGPDVQARAFEPFFTTKGPRGTGLGLAVVQEIVERHGGTISVASRTSAGDEHGSTFSIVLPAQVPGVVAPAEATATPAKQGARLRVVAVDDEPDLRDMMALMLGNDGHHVRVASSADEALALLAAGPYDLLISDVGMPGTNGWELAAQVRARWPKLRIVLATGWGAEIDPQDARRRGIAAVIAKPFRFSDLRQVLDSGA